MYDPEPKFQPKAQLKVQPKVTVPSHLRESGQVGNWLFYNGAGDKLFDFSEKENHGLIEGSKWVDGPFGWALSFDGADDRVNVGDSASLDFGTGDFSVLVWLNPDSGWGDNYDAPISKANYSDAGNWEGYHFEALSDQTVDFYARTDHIATTTALSPGQWWHLAGVRRGGTIYVYVNGSLENSGTADRDVSTAYTFFIGKNDDPDYPRNFPGDIALVRVYDSGLSDGEVSSHFQQTKGIFGV